MDTGTRYVKVSSYEAKKGEFDRCLLLYSGGLDTSVMLKWIQEHYESKVVALTVDLGQTADDLTAIKQKALKLGAEDCIMYDAKNRFADELLSEAIMANADYQGGYALGCPLGRVMISKIAVQQARKYGCQVIAHGCTGKGNDQVRFESYITTLDPSLKIIAPVREWGMGREEEIQYAEKHGIPITQKKETPYSYDENMWSNTAEGGEIEDPELVPKLPQILQWCNTIEKAPDTKERVVLEFDKGIPVAVNGKKLALCDIIKQCNTIGGRHGVGVTHLIEDRIVGLKVRGVYENPAALLLIAAHKKLELLVSTRLENEFKPIVDNKWSYLTYGAQWYNPIMDNLRAYIYRQNQKVTGTVTVELYKGNITVVALTSPNSLFDANLATFERNASFNQNCSSGFIELYNLPQKCAYGISNKATQKGYEAKRKIVCEEKNNAKQLKFNDEKGDQNSIAADETLTLPKINSNSGANAKFYNDWALNYKKDVDSLGYNTPQQVATILKEHVPADRICSIEVLDAGAGTGLSGEALKKIGFMNILGIDVSQKMVDIGKTKGCYKEMEVVDMNKPMKYKDNQFDVVICVGTTTYLKIKVLADFIRVTKSGGLVCCTFRTDIIDKWHAEHEKLILDGKWESVKITEPMPYLPNHPDYGSKIKVVAYLWRVR